MYNDIVALSKLRKVFEDLSDQFGTEKLEEGYSLTGGFAFKSVDYKENGHFVLRVTNIMPDGSINNKGAKFISNSEVENYQDYSLSKGDVLIVMIGGSIGKVGYISSKHLPALLNQNLWKITSKNNLDNRYVFYLALYICFFYGLQKNTSYAFYSRKKFKEINVPKITRDGSLRVAKFLDEYLIKDEQNDCDCLKSTTVKELFSMADSSNSISLIKNEFKSQQVLLKKLRQQILQDAIEGKLTQDWREQNPNVEPASELLKRIEAEKQQLIEDKKIKKQKPLPAITDDEKPFELPESWEWDRLGNICSKVTDGFHNTPKKLDNGRIYISATHIRETGVKWNSCLYVSENDHQELYRKTYPQKGEILITNRGAGCATPAIIDIEEQFSFQNAALIGFNQGMVNNKYIYYLILKMRDEIMKVFVSGGLQPMLSNVKLREIPVSFPPFEEQKEIVKKVKKLFAICDQLEGQITSSQTNAEQLMQSVLKEAFSQESAA